MKKNRFEIVESIKKLDGSTAYSLQKCNFVADETIASTLTLESKINVPDEKSEIFFKRETDVFLGIVTALSEKSGFPVYNSVKI